MSALRQDRGRDERASRAKLKHMLKVLASTIREIDHRKKRELKLRIDLPFYRGITEFWVQYPCLRVQCSVFGVQIVKSIAVERVA